MKVLQAVDFDVVEMIQSVARRKRGGQKPERRYRCQVTRRQCMIWMRDCAWWMGSMHSTVNGRGISSAPQHNPWS